MEMFKLNMKVRRPWTHKFNLNSHSMSYFLEVQEHDVDGDEGSDREEGHEEGEHRLIVGPERIVQSMVWGHGWLFKLNTEGMQCERRLFKLNE
jgi:hypothetical protein